MTMANGSSAAGCVKTKRGGALHAPHTTSMQLHTARSSFTQGTHLTPPYFADSACHSTAAATGMPAFLTALLALLLATIITTSFASSTTAAAATSAQGPVTLAEVDRLTFRVGEVTTAQRTASVPTLACEGDHCEDVALAEVECFNTGALDEDGGVVWECVAELDHAYRMRVSQINCEGWRDDADVETVLEGSCQLVYTITEAQRDGGGDACTPKGLAAYLVEAYWGGLTLLEVTLLVVVALLSAR